MSLRKKALALAVVTAVGGGLALTATPASASISQGYVSGAGDPTNDWGDEGTLSSGSHANSNATALVQLLLWADGAKEKNGTTFDYADIDGRYGSNTTAAVKSWQKLYNSREGAGLVVDGKAGPKTLGAADVSLADNGDGTVTFWGWKHDVTFKRSGGKYYVKVNNTRGWKLASYNTLNVV
ncbi:peptidoglycan-binding protein [Streptomyces aquilus]|uniref:Peptidoglycan-binding protein n=1 Tax=Streptomyces aquilus TaxID=2548456 RepID=A0A3S9I4I6_9ACTN|nr:peptidoglycan-binding protein [Streptomyces aquilus]AZP19279.1 peptidoglycan-binding protein [Streptomyces aquilus]